MKKLGLSGDQIVINQDNIIKICETNQERFLKNINRQKSFKYPEIQSVPILEHFVIENKHHIKMPYLKCGDAVSWLATTNIVCLNNLIEKFQSYFVALIKDSQIDNFDYLTWHNKIQSLKKDIKDHDLLHVINTIDNIKFNQSFYYGNYHGDFTFSNMLISNTNANVTIDVIDFLDSFIHSPIHDFVKIRQDTKHFWTLHLLRNDENIDKIRVATFLNFIDKSIEKCIQNNCILQEYYLPFQILNLLRIIPYNKDIETFAYLKKEIIKLFNEGKFE
jgi:hypothetical protein